MGKMPATDPLPGKRRVGTEPGAGCHIRATSIACQAGGDGKPIAWSGDDLSSECDDTTRILPPEFWPVGPDNQRVSPFSEPRRASRTTNYFLNAKSRGNASTFWRTQLQKTGRAKPEFRVIASGWFRGSGYPKRGSPGSPRSPSRSVIESAVDRHESHNVPRSRTGSRV